MPPPSTSTTIVPSSIKSIITVTTSTPAVTSVISTSIVSTSVISAVVASCKPIKCGTLSGAIIPTTFAVTISTTLTVTIPTTLAVTIPTVVVTALLLFAAALAFLLFALFWLALAALILFVSTSFSRCSKSTGHGQRIAFLRLERNNPCSVLISGGLFLAIVGFTPIFSIELCDVCGKLFADFLGDFFGTKSIKLLDNVVNGFGVGNHSKRIIHKIRNVVEPHTPFRGKVRNQGYPQFPTFILRQLPAHTDGAIVGVAGHRDLSFWHELTRKTTFKQPKVSHTKPVEKIELFRTSNSGHKNCQT
mmetsp:Transcript_104776/g.293697  ORF Transcript_104776/g.293697 Transcript_104776/m.293697 type:complete len:304 (-) Transcript_104776:89-1000(-)